MPVNIMVSVVIGVGGYGCPTSCNVLWIAVPSLHVTKSASVSVSASALAADGMACFKIPNTVITPPLCMTVPLFGSELTKNYVGWPSQWLGIIVVRSITVSMEDGFTLLIQMVISHPGVSPQSPGTCAFPALPSWLLRSASMPIVPVPLCNIDGSTVRL